MFYSFAVSRAEVTREQTSQKATPLLEAWRTGSLDPSDTTWTNRKEHSEMESRYSHQQLSHPEDLWRLYVESEAAKLGGVCTFLGVTVCLSSCFGCYLSRRRCKRSVKVIVPRVHLVIGCWLNKNMYSNISAVSFCFGRTEPEKNVEMIQISLFLRVCVQKACKK